VSPAQTTWNTTSAEFEVFARARGIRLLLQFGSTVTGREHAASDLDLAVLLDRPPSSLLESAGLATDLQPFFPDRELDLIVLNRADPLLLKQVLEGCRLLYGTPRTLAELRLYGFKRYQDHRRFLAMERAYVRRAIAPERRAMTVDVALVVRKLALIAGDLEGLADVASRPREAFLASRIDQAVAERLLERTIGRMIDVNYHLITEHGQPPPSDYYTSFLKLADLGILEAGVARRLAPSAGLRNRLVHEYEEVDPAKVFEALSPARADIIDYVRAVEAFLTRNEGEA
jgi:uncharacterized protein YutE (UPF0331/DUF86 family)/predicted nucleotidyltransferase